METKERKLHLSICDYNKRVVCPLYDNQSNVSGQAVDIFVSTERNGWKELSFTLPSVCIDETGTVPNFRIDFLKADFLIRLIDENETDWFIISEPKVTHNAYSKNISVTAGHVSQLLKLKNLGLEFSDDEGNNIGTAKQLLQTILSGTGWTAGYVYPFAEKNGSTKYRSLKASAKTGAFKLIATMCDLFDAKPVYHGDTRTVDIIPINPFSEPEPGMLPNLSQDNEVVELHYGKNVSNVKRTLNTENIVTKLYAYGSYGDKTSGYCGIDECFHTEYEYTLNQKCNANTTYHFTFKDDADVSITYNFTPDVEVKSGSLLIFSLLDPASMMYIWDETNKKAYPVTKGTYGTALPVSKTEKQSKQNWFQFVMNYDYYRSVGLLSDEMIRVIADFQRSAPSLYQNSIDASNQMSEAQTVLSKAIGYIDFCKLDIEGANDSIGGNYLTLKLNKDQYSDGVIYRTDYDQRKDNYFEWNVADSLNSDGDPLNSAASIVYIVHNTDPVTWDKAYLKQIDDKDNPTNITLWIDKNTIQIDPMSDQFILFSYNGINGILGSLEANDESALMALEEATRVVTVDHPVVFTDKSPDLIGVGNVNGYGWLWRYYSDKTNFRAKQSELYFAFTSEGDSAWNYVHFSDQTPTNAKTNEYWYDWRNSVLHRRTSSAWSSLTSSAEERVAALFSTVYTLCKTRDKYYQGLYEEYKYTVPSGSSLKPGNYFIQNEFDSYWAFTVNEELKSGDTLTYQYTKAQVEQIKNGISTILKPKNYRFDNVNYHSSNILSGISIEDGSMDPTSGKLSESSSSCRTRSYVSVVPSTKYSVSGAGRNIVVHFYNDKKIWLSASTVSSIFTTPDNCSYVRFSADVSVANFTSYANMRIYASQLNDTIVIEDLNYSKLTNVTVSGELIGLVQSVSKMISYANWTYGTYYNALKSAQNAISEKENEMTSIIGDLYREGWWQDASYIDGDEDKLYIDVLDNLNQIAKPEAVYSITYIDPYGSNGGNLDFGVVDETTALSWPDVSTASAIHLVDPEIAVNTWAFVDKIQKCYDKPWQTKVSINTNLSTIAQHSFADVMTNIASVASEMKNKTSYYDKTIGGIVDPKLVVQLAANIVATEKDFNSSYSRIEQREDSTIRKMTEISQDADSIRFMAESASSAIDGIDDKVAQAVLKIDPEQIMGLVEESKSYKELAESFQNAANEYNGANEKANAAAESAKSAIAAAESRNKIYAQDNAPTTAAVNDLWIDTNDENKLYRYTKAGWTSARDTTFATAAQLTVTNDNISSVVGLVATDEKGNPTFYGGSQLRQEMNKIQSAIYDEKGNTKSILSQTENAIVSAVKSKSKTNMYNYVVINDSGIGIKANGAIDMESGSELKIKSGSNMNIESGGNISISAGGSFTVDSGNFDIDNNGKLYASDAVINGNISSRGYPVLTKDYDIYVGSEQPATNVAHVGMLWIKPGVPSGGSGGSSGGSTTPSVPVNNTVTFTQSPYFADNYLFTSSGNADGPQTATLNANQTSSANSGSYQYSVTLPLVIEGRSDGAKTGGNITLSINGGAVKFVWEELEYGASTSDRFITLTQDVRTDIWLGSSTSIVATLSVKQHDSGYKTGAWATSTTSPIKITCKA